MSMSVCVCPLVCAHTLRQGLTALRMCVCVGVCVLSHSSKCAAGIPGHLREQREADRWAEEDVGSERRLPEKRVGEEGMRKKLKGLDISAAKPPL